MVWVFQTRPNGRPTICGEVTNISRMVCGIEARIFSDTDGVAELQGLPGVFPVVVLAILETC